MNAYAPCPKCNAAVAEKLKFTWWGGVLGPKLLTHVKCQACGKKYNGKTGRENTVNIIIYGLVAGVICFVLFFLLAVAFVLLNPK
jgi:hypothetical protein